MVKKVAIVGAGPSGLLLAHYLLRRGERYKIDIYDRRSDPRKVPFSNSRTFPISLNERGMRALRNIEGLEEAVEAISLKMTGTIFHQRNGKQRVTNRKKALTTLDRTSLAIVLLEKVTERYNSSHIDVHFDCQCTNVDFTAKKLKFQNLESETDFEVDYDILIGADGSRSVVREHFARTKDFHCEQKYVPNNYKSIFLPPPKDAKINLEQGKIHSWILKDGTLVVLLHQRFGGMGGVILFLHNKNQVDSLSTTDEVCQFFQSNFPEVAQLMPQEEAEAFLARPTSRILTIRCDRYHEGDSVLLIGDAAHAVSSSIGQGCNAALEDVVLLDALLNEYSDDFLLAIEQFTVRRKQDALALVELGDNAFPSTTRLFIEFALRESVARFLHKVFPQYFIPPLSELIFETTTPYSDILDLYKGWISKVRKSNASLQ
ncbi:FAD-dependent oxidoreductase [Scytonema sp. NUACC26]|uniref:FAD-dependent oxidoreductase n=1 Tax=Scytonema sp. NUACC26 TaxID=3140176 RepID=UPI0034DB9485